MAITDSKWWKWLSHLSTASWLYSIAAGSATTAVSTAWASLNTWQGTLLGLSAAMTILAYLSSRVTVRGHTRNIPIQEDLFSDASDLPWATEKELQAPSLKGKRFRLVDIPTVKGVISDRKWENCLIEGPALVYPAMLKMTFSQIDGIAKEDAEGTFYEKEGLAVGIIAFDDCVIRHCTLRNIGFVGPRDLLNVVRQGFGLPPRPETTSP